MGGPSCSPLHPAGAGRVWCDAQRPPSGHRRARSPAGHCGRARIATRPEAEQPPKPADSFHEFLVNQGLGFNQRRTFASTAPAIGRHGIWRHMGAHLWDAVPVARVFGLQRTGHASLCRRCRRLVDLATKGPARSSVTDRRAVGAPESHVWSPERARVMNPVRQPLQSRPPPAEDPCSGRPDQFIRCGSCRAALPTAATAPRRGGGPGRLGVAGHARL